MKPDEKDTDHGEIKRQHAAAADIARGKLSKLYDNEPEATEEIKEVVVADKRNLSKHQRFMEELSKSGRGLAEIQTAWHEYYAGLSDAEKHEVWQEFYDQHARSGGKKPTVTPPEQSDKVKEPEEEQPTEPEAPQVLPPRQAVQPSNEAPPKPVRRTRTRRTATTPKRRTAPAAHPERTVSAVKEDLLHTVSSRSKLRKVNHHVRALGFGLSMGFLVVLILLFSFFNERFITPFIRPSQHVSATPIIVDPGADTNVGPEPKIIIPKINVEATVVYDEPSIDDAAVQGALERGVLHYATTPDPGQLGNAVIFGHSSGNILNKGKYKFAFLLLKSVEKGDTFMLQKDGKRYVYKVYNKFITSPSDLSVLNPPTDRKAIVTLITCDPPGLSTNRLIIQAEQIYPDPTANVASTTLTDPSKQPKVIPGNSESLWHRLTN
jgi:LPXTG-site transpeptidase (sortase) family protein